MKPEYKLRDVTPYDQYTREEYIAFLANGLVCLYDLMQARNKRQDQGMQPAYHRSEDSQNAGSS